MQLAQQIKMRQSQSLVMTPQLQQAIKLLQMTNIELCQYLENQQSENPFLEIETSIDSKSRSGEENKNEKIMIISGDKDFIQLQKYPNVTQWSPITKKQVNGFDPTIYLKEHILKGDTSDGVPNVLSPDNTFVDGLRQRPLSRKKIQSWLLGGGSDWNDEVKRNFQRNSTLIDLSRTPEELKNQIRLEYNNAPHGDRSKLLNYFMQNKLKELTENIGEF